MTQDFFPFFKNSSSTFRFFHRLEMEGEKKRTPYMVALDTTKRCMCTEEEECNQDLVSVSPSSFLFGLRYIFIFFPDVEEEKGERCIIFFPWDFLTWARSHGGCSTIFSSSIQTGQTIAVVA